MLRCTEDCTYVFTYWKRCRISVRVLLQPSLFSYFSKFSLEKAYAGLHKPITEGEPKGGMVSAGWLGEPTLVENDFRGDDSFPLHWLYRS